jgi:hypothetical protein
VPVGESAVWAARWWRYCVGAAWPYERWFTTTTSVPMARLHRENRYDRVTNTVEEITGRPAESIEEFVARSDVFAALRMATSHA